MLSKQRSQAHLLLPSFSMSSFIVFISNGVLRFAADERAKNKETAGCHRGSNVKLDSSAPSRAGVPNNSNIKDFAFGFGSVKGANPVPQTFVTRNGKRGASISLLSVFWR